jgi:DNA-binding NtrC family response regulator
MTDQTRDIDILIIDDEPTVASALSRMLRLEGFGVETAQTAKEGLSKIKSQRYSLLICDQNMPEMPGIQLIKKAHEEGFEGREILITGLERTPEVAYAASNGLEVFHKPWNTEILKQKVHEVLQSEPERQG